MEKRTWKVFPRFLAHSALPFYKRILNSSYPDKHRQTNVIHLLISSANILVRRVLTLVSWTLSAYCLNGLLTHGDAVVQKNYCLLVVKDFLHLSYEYLHVLKAFSLSPCRLSPFPLCFLRDSEHWWSPICLWHPDSHPIWTQESKNRIHLLRLKFNQESGMFYDRSKLESYKRVLWKSDIKTETENTQIIRYSQCWELK